MGVEIQSLEVEGPSNNTKEGFTKGGKSSETNAPKDCVAGQGAEENNTT